MKSAVTGRVIKILLSRIYTYLIILLSHHNGKASVEKRSFLILPENLNVSGSVSTEQRQRSIYSVLLYNSALNGKRNFQY